MFPALYVLFVVIVSPGAGAVIKWDDLNLRDHVDTWAFPMSSPEACAAGAEMFRASADTHPPGTAFFFQCAKIAHPTPEIPA
jgi:hypothetical protein